MANPLLSRVHRIKGQVEGIERMLAQNEDCLEIVTQIQAVRESLGSLGQQILTNEMSSCVDETNQAQTIAKLRSFVHKLLKLT